MADGSNIITLPTSRMVAQEAARRPVLVHSAPEGPQSNAFGFPAVDALEPRERVEVTAGLTKVYATRVDGMIWAQFDSATLAIRCADHLRGLIELGALFPQPPVTPEAA